ncbi:unnamed protein product [Rotaria socialis]|uniref:Uncharacterized protein n=1 Tax=Rotaria socialis TaxID=392032 RepID=A0A819VBD4_9BILA|nr:unnamed protein product [Rotaria socialis]CAF4120387.1 unnamed protein product [Rotaria socialis]CAF4521313.1 unnamed protein product [Rotaria socialis]CAF4594837.1 unnamed protein product [Rotaria socialis]
MRSYQRLSSNIAQQLKFGYTSGKLEQNINTSPYQHPQDIVTLVLLGLIEVHRSNIIDCLSTVYLQLIELNKF